MQYIVRAYYHSSETSYAFGPFNSERALNIFLLSDRAHTHPTENALDKRRPSHERWEVIAINKPSLYGTGDELSADNWVWDD